MKCPEKAQTNDRIWRSYVSFVYLRVMLINVWPCNMNTIIFSSQDNPALLSLFYKIKAWCSETLQNVLKVIYWVRERFGDVTQICLLFQFMCLQILRFFLSRVNLGYNHHFLKLTKIGTLKKIISDRKEKWFITSHFNKWSLF